MIPSGKLPYDWTPERVKRLIELVEVDGLTSQQVADRLPGEVSRNAVIGKAARLGLRWAGPKAVPRRTPAEIAWLADEPRLREMIGKGWPARAVAQALGRTIDSVKDKARRLDLSFGQPPPRPERARNLPEAARPTSAERATTFGPVPFLDRRPGQCCWPLWEPPARTGLVCGAIAAAAAEPYCAEHRSVAWVGTRHTGKRVSAVTQTAGEEWR